MPRLISLAVAVLLCCPMVAVAASPLVGTWRVVAMEGNGKRVEPPKGTSMTIEFRQGGKFVTVATAQGKSNRVEGTWTSEGSKVTTVIRSNRETINFEIKGRRLKLVKSKEAPAMILERVAK
jgi:uncharacterized protein (TIGR03066 family)